MERILDICMDVGIYIYHTWILWVMMLLPSFSSEGWRVGDPFAKKNGGKTPPNDLLLLLLLLLLSFWFLCVTAKAGANKQNKQVMVVCFFAEFLCKSRCVDVDVVFLADRTCREKPFQWLWKKFLWTSTMSPEEWVRKSCGNGARRCRNTSNVTVNTKIMTTPVN